MGAGHGCELPSAITFWIKVSRVPLPFWVDETFQSIGEARREFHELNLNTVRINVTLDGFKPLYFETTVEFGPR